jgi:hypothetical protein
MFTRMDSNKDGQVDVNEHKAAWSNWFERIDVNHDEKVSMDEVTTYRNRLHGKAAADK